MSMLRTVIVDVADVRAAGEERGPHVDVVLEVLDVGHVAVLAEELGLGDERARRRRVELVRRVGEHDDIAGARRVGHVGRGVSWTVRDVAGLGLGEDAVDDLPALGLAVARPVVRIGDRLEGGLIGSTRRRLVGGRDLLQAAAGGVAAGQVEVDLHRAAGPAGLGLADRLARGRPAVRGLRRRQQSEIDEHLAGVDGQELRREAVVRADERGDVARVRHLVEQILRQPHRRVRTLVRAADVTLALLDEPIRRAVDRTSSYAGLASPPGSVGETRPRNWCWNSSVAG